MILELGVGGHDPRLNRSVEIVDGKASRERLIFEPLFGNLYPTIKHRSDQLYVVIPAHKVINEVGTECDLFGQRKLVIESDGESGFKIGNLLVEELQLIPKDLRKL